MSGFVYFILCEPMGAVKIGFTRSSPDARMKSLQTGCPAPLKLWSYFAASMDEERRLHDVFAPLSIQGEWFRFEAMLQDFVWYMEPVAGTKRASREAFEIALHDVLMQAGGWHPESDLTYGEYNASGNWEPFRDLLWNKFGPWEEVDG